MKKVKLLQKKYKMCNLLKIYKILIKLGKIGIINQYSYAYLSKKIHKIIKKILRNFTDLQIKI